MEQLCCHWTDIHEIWYLNIFGKSAEKIQVSLKYDKNNGTSYEYRYRYTFLSTSCRVLLKMRNVSEKNLAEKTKTHILISMTFF
jgi:hypothetical protein